MTTFGPVYEHGDVFAQELADTAEGPRAKWREDKRRAREAARAALLLPRPCLACNREQGERMCDLCQRLEVAEASAP